MKVCTKCKIEQQLENFYYYIKKESYFSWCKECMKFYAKNRKLYRRKYYHNNKHRKDISL